MFIRKSPCISLLLCCLAMTACTSATSGKYSYRPTSHALNSSPSPAATETADAAPKSPAVTPGQEVISAPVLRSPSASAGPSRLKAPTPLHVAADSAPPGSASATVQLNPLTVFPKKTAADQPRGATQTSARAFPEAGTAIPMNPLTVFPKTAVVETPAAAQASPRSARTAESTLPRDMPATPAPATEPTAPSYPSLLKWAASQPGDRKTQATINDPIFGRVIVARLDGDYFSAAGLNCRRVKVSAVIDGAAAETISVCRENQGEWFMAPRGGISTVPGGSR